MFFNQKFSIRSILILSLTLLSFSFHSYGFQKVLKTSDLYKRIINTKDEAIYLENVRLMDDVSKEMADSGMEFFEALEQILGSAFDYDSTGIKTNVKLLDIYKIYGNRPKLEFLRIDTVNIVKGELNELTISKFRTNELRIDSLSIADRLLIQDSKFGSYSSYKNTVDYFECLGNDFEDFFETNQDLISTEYTVMDCLFKEGANFTADVKGNYINVRLVGNDFEPIDSNLSFPLDNAFQKSDTLIMKNQATMNFFGLVNQAEISENIFLADTVNNIDQFFRIHGDFEYMVITANDIGVTMHPTATVSKQFIMDENNFTADFIFANFILEGRNNVLRWSEIANFKLGSHVQFGGFVAEEPELFGYTQADIPKIFQQTGGYLQRTYKAETDIELDDVEPFQRLLSSYYRLYKAFKENGDLDQANEVYVEMKDVQLKELSYQYHTYGGLENWIEWRLNYILRVYTDYGTKPAKAIKLSVWVVLLFSIFYFFFPSEWDTKSKGQLIEDYKLFVEKNDHGYFKPFTKLSFGFGKSLLNAFTLSLNSFVTLGFGTIPTTGLARYICILQGFLGWFLLSIFTASLINQVLF